jgi:hypothetical protein
LWEGSGRETADNTGYTGFHITCSQAVHPNVGRKMKHATDKKVSKKSWICNHDFMSCRRKRGTVFWKFLLNQWREIKADGSGESHSDPSCVPWNYSLRKNGYHSFFSETSSGLNIEDHELIEFKWFNFFYKFHLLSIVIHI